MMNTNICNSKIVRSKLKEYINEYLSNYNNDILLTDVKHLQSIHIEFWMDYSPLPTYELCSLTERTERSEYSEIGSEEKVQYHHEIQSKLRAIQMKDRFLDILFFYKELGMLQAVICDDFVCNISLMDDSNRNSMSNIFAEEEKDDCCFLEIENEHESGHIFCKQKSVPCSDFIQMLQSFDDNINMCEVNGDVLSLNVCNLVHDTIFHSNMNDSCLLMRLKRFKQSAVQIKTQKSRKNVIMKSLQSHMANTLRRKFRKM